MAGELNIAAVLRLVATVTSPEELTEVLQAACRAIVELLGVDHSGIVLFSEDGSLGRLETEYPPGLVGSKTEIAMRGVHPEIALLNGHGFKYDDVSQAVALGPVRDMLLSHGIQSILVEPIRRNDVVVASFSVDCINRRHHFTPDEEETCKAIATLLGVAYIKVAELEAAKRRANNASELENKVSLMTEAASWAEKAHKDAHFLQHADTPEEASERLMESVKAQGVSIVLCNAAGEISDRYTAGNANNNTLLRSNGISVQVISSGRSWTTSDAQNERAINAHALLPDDRAMACLPMSHRDEAVGVVWLSFSEYREFGTAELAHFQGCVDSVTSICLTASNWNAANRLVAITQQAAGRADLLDLTTALVKYARVSFRAVSVAYWPWDSESNRFIPQLLVADGIPEVDLEYFRSNEPRADHITFRTLTTGYYEVPDVRSNPLTADTLEHLQHAGVESFQAVVLDTGSEKLGVLYVSYSYTRSFGRDDRSALASFSSYASWLIKNTRQSRRAAAGLQLAQRLAHEFTIGNDWIQTLQFICLQAVEICEATNAVLFRYEQSSNTLMPPTTAGSLDDLAHLQRCAPIQAGAWLSEILQSATSMAVENVEEHPLYSQKRFAQTEKIRTFIAVPLRALSRTVGLLFVNFQSRHRVTEREKQDIQLLADFAATAIHNAQHYEYLASTSTALLGCSTSTEVLDIAVRETARLMGTSLSDIMLLNSDGEMTMGAAYGWGKALDGFSQLPSQQFQCAYTLEMDRPIWVDDFDLEDRFEVPDVVREMRLKSALSVPLKRDGQSVGVVLVHTKTSRQFRESDAYLLDSLGNQIMQALERARHFEEKEAKRANIEALDESSRALIRSIRDLNTENAYTVILEQANRCLQGKVDLATLLLYDPQTEVLSAGAVYPAAREEELRRRVGSRWSVKDGHSDTPKVGISGLAIQRRASVLVHDVEASDATPYYVRLSDTTKSNLAVPLLLDSSVPVGVLNVESNRNGAFDMRDQEILQSLALVIVSVLEVEQQHRSLMKARGEAKARLVLAWVGLAANHGWHSARGDLATIRGAVVNIMQELSLEFGNAVPPQVLDNLNLVDHLCNEMLSLDLTPPLERHNARSDIAVNEFMREFVREVESRRNRCFTVEAALGVPDDTLIFVNVSWLRCALKILVDNAARELGHVQDTPRVLRLISRIVGTDVELVVQDSGRGIPDDVQRALGKDVVTGAMSIGVGYLIAQAVAETYDGTLTYTTGSTGTSMVVGFPLSAERAQ